MEFGETQEDPQSGFRLWGFIGAPGVSRATREDQHIFVNKRPVDNRGVNFALLEGYHTALMKGRYPVCCLFLEVHPAEVDVNIHPAKREVKFRREKAIRTKVAQAVHEALLRLNVQSQPQAETNTPSRQMETQPSPAESTVSPQPSFDLQAQSAPEAKPEPAELPNFPRLSKPLVQWPQSMPVQSANTPIVRQSAAASLPLPTSAPISQVPVPLLQVPLRVIGVIGNLYVVLESDRGLVLLDQHAAHERVLFEQMLARMESDTQAPSQRLLLPETVELSARDAHFLREQLPVLSRLGIGLNEFGERTFLLDALPPFVQAHEPRAFAMEVIDELKAAGQSVNTLRLGEHIIAKTVCRHAVKAHDPLSRPELEKLIEDLRLCKMPYTCPHGRPTLIEMNFREIDRKFGRIA
jgi:DNA mismatch repair protein MutL